MYFNVYCKVTTGNQYPDIVKRNVHANTIEDAEMQGTEEIALSVNGETEFLTVKETMGKDGPEKDTLWGVKAGKVF